MSVSPPKMNLEYRPRRRAVPSAFHFRYEYLFTSALCYLLYPSVDTYLLPSVDTYLLTYLLYLDKGEPRWPLLDPGARSRGAPRESQSVLTETVATGMHLAAGPSEPAKCSRRPRECSSARWPEGEQGRLRRARECSAGAWGCARAPMGSTARSSRRRRASTCRTSCRSSATAAPSPSWRLERRLLLDDSLQLAQRRHTTW